MPGKTVVVLGGGVGGLVVANRLRKKLDPDHRIVLVDKSPTHHFAPSFPWLAMGWRRVDSISRDIRRLLKKGVGFVQAEVINIDTGARTVTTDRQEIAYDYLVIALGADLAPQALPGLSEAAYTFYQVDEAARLQGAIGDFSSGTAMVMVSSLPFKCPAAPYEAALMLDYIFRKRGIRNQVDLKFYTPEPSPLPVAGPAVGGMVQELLSSRDIEYKPNHKVASIDSDGKHITFDDGGQERFDLLVAVPPHTSPKAVKTSDLINEAGWIPVDSHTLAAGAENVYAIGDITTVMLPVGMPLPKAGVFAHREAEVVAENISSEIQERGDKRTFDGHGSCFLEIGFGKAAYATGDFYATPTPAVKLMGPSRLWHWRKLLFERAWLNGWF